MKRLFLLFFLVACTASVPQVCINQACFNVEIVDTEEERQLGLMHREYLNQDEGMLFIFENTGNYPFWMKNTLIPLDIIWILDDEIVAINPNTPPCESDPCPNYNPNAQANYVLEINGGFAEQLDIKIGDKVILPTFK